MSPTNPVHLDFDQFAEQMLRDYDNRTPGTLFADGLRLTLDDARRIQDTVAQLRQRRGERVVGYKIGSVSAINQRRNGLPHPVWGRLWSTEQHASGVQLSKGSFAGLAIEGELALTFGSDVHPGDSIDRIVDSVELVIPVIELHNLIFQGADPKGPELIANNTIHAGVVRGIGVHKPAEPNVADLTLDLDGTTAGQWTNICWPNDLVQFIGWLMDGLTRSGLSLQRGHTVLTGALGPPLFVADVDHVRVSSSQFGTVEAWFVNRCSAW